MFAWLGQKIGWHPSPLVHAGLVALVAIVIGLLAHEIVYAVVVGVGGVFTAALRGRKAARVAAPVGAHVAQPPATPAAPVAAPPSDQPPAAGPGLYGPG